MSYNEDVVISKLSTLNETQESIVNVSQWVMFHKRYANKTAEIWANQLAKAPANKKLALIYLTNEVVQQTRARRKDEFVNAYARVIVDAIGSVYRQVPKEVREKIKRVVGVWRQRSIFDSKTLDGIDSKIASVETGGSSGTSTSSRSSQSQSRGFGFGSMGVPQDLKDVCAAQTEIDENSSPADKTFESVVKSYNDLFDSDALPAPAAYSKQLGEVQSKLEKCLSHHESSVNARKRLLELLRPLVEANETKLARQEQQLAELVTKKDHAVETKKEVDEMLVSEEDAAATGTPEMEAFTPPGEPPSAAVQEEEEEEEEGQKSFVPEYAPDEDSNNAAPAYSPLSSDDEDGGDAPAPKKQKTENGEESNGGSKQAPSGDVKLEGLDPAVAKLLASMK